MLKFSIITINLNNASGLVKTIESIINQKYKYYEYIIIDGSSTDGSVDIIREYADKITFWVSESDKGIYNAMNKGIAASKGEYCLFLNSGDYLPENNTLEKLSSETNGEDIIYGNWYKSYSSGRIKPERFPQFITFYFLAFHYSLPHQATLIRRDLFDKIGFYDEGLKMVSDWKFFFDRTF